MKERNAYTLTLAAVGIAAVLIALTSVAVSGRAWELLLLSMVLSIVSFFPIKLPNRFWYSFDHIAAGYLLIEFDWKMAIIPSIIGMIALNLHSFSKLKQNLIQQIFRFFVSLGMYSISLFAATMIMHFSKSSNILVEVSLIIFTLDISSLIINKSVHMSILGRSVLSKVTFKSSLYPSIFLILSILLSYQLVNTDTYPQLIHEVIFCGLIILVIFIIAKVAVSHEVLAEERRLDFEQSLTATGQLLLILDLQGRILSTNPVTEQLLKMSDESLKKLSVYKLSHDQRDKIQQYFSEAVSGVTQSTMLILVDSELNPVPIEASFVPFFRNKQVAGIYLLGRMSR